MRAALFAYVLSGALVAALPARGSEVEFGTQGGWGTMRLDREARSVSIDVVAVNAHTCMVRGRLTGARLDRVEAEEGCRFQLQGKQQGVFSVIVDEAAREACRGSCGARAWFEGDYLPLPAACTQAGLAGRQREALQAYRGKRFDRAFQLWSQGLADCEKTMSWTEVWRWRNDAAIAAFHLGRRGDCSRLAQAVLADVKGVTLDGETALRLRPQRRRDRQALGRRGPPQLGQVPAGALRRDQRPGVCRASSATAGA